MTGACAHLPPATPSRRQRARALAASRADEQREERGDHACAAEAARRGAPSAEVAGGIVRHIALGGNASRGVPDVVLVVEDAGHALVTALHAAFAHVVLTGALAGPEVRGLLA